MPASDTAPRRTNKSVMLDEDTHAALEKLARRNGRTNVGQIRWMIAQHSD